MKIIDDTLKKANGKWDKQALTMFVSFLMAIFLGTYIVVSDFYLSKEINPYAIVVEGYFVALSGGTAVMNIWNKKVDNRIENNIINTDETQVL